MDIKQFLSEFKANLSSPESYLTPTPELSSKCLAGLKTVFDFYKKCTKKGSVSIPTGPLSELYTEGFDNDQIWEEIQLLNEPVLGYLGNILGEMEGWDHTELFSGGQTADEQLQSDKAGYGHKDLEQMENYDSDENAEQYDEEDVEEGDSDGVEGARGRTAVHTGRKTVVDDKFFKLSEMEQYLEKMEREEEQGGDRESEEEGDDIDYFLEGPQVSGAKASYADFFDPPNQDVDQTEGVANEDVKTGVELPQEIDPAEMDDDGDDIDGLEDEEGEPLGDDEEEEHGEEDQAAVDENSSEKLEDTEQPVLSAREKKKLKLRKQVEQLEAANIAERSWQMSGETSAKARPLNSLLEEDLTFDHMSRPPPVITEETTKTLEDIIKQRVIDEAWDDVERRIKPPEKPYDYSKSRPLDQEKSKLSLAEVYEQEYIKQTQGAAEVKEDERHTEIREQMKKLFVKLDALSNFHFTPKPPKPEVKIVPSVPAIQMEEVAPLATSDAMLVAPEEVQAKSRKPEVGTTEKTVTDRKRERRLKKKQKRLRLAEKRHREKIISQIRPGLGNKYSRKELSKKLKQREQDEVVDKSLRSSSKFFARLQDKVLDEVKAVKGERTTKDIERTTSGKHFKL